LAQVVVQQATETLSPLDLPTACPNTYGWRDQPVLQPLMVPLVMVVLDEFTNSSAKRTLTEQDQPVQARFLDAPDEAFRVGVQVRRPRGQFYWFNAATFEHRKELTSEQRIAIMDEVTLSCEQTIDWISQIAADLGHPQPIRVGSNASNLDPARGKLDEEQDDKPL
jgi:hypothetical protein